MYDKTFNRLNGRMNKRYWTTGTAALVRIAIDVVNGNFLFHISTTDPDFSWNVFFYKLKASVRVEKLLWIHFFFKRDPDSNCSSTAR